MSAPKRQPRGVMSGREAARMADERALTAARREAFRDARRGLATPLEYRDIEHRQSFWAWVRGWFR